MKNQISETVEVIAYFHNLHLEILKFKWKDDIYNVSKINSQWRIPMQNSYEYHFTVTCDKQNTLCELAFNMNDFKWELVQYEYYC
jgi:hypothetical protein